VFLRDVNNCHIFCWTRNFKKQRRESKKVTSQCMIKKQFDGRIIRISLQATKVVSVTVITSCQKSNLKRHHVVQLQQQQKTVEEIVY
jgi:hypothetical protein